MAATELEALLEQSAARHGHVCPRQVLGVRMGLLAARLLELSLPQTEKRLLTLVETDGCFADGVAVATGCEIGHRTLRLVDYGKVAATFIDTETLRSFRIFPHLQSRESARAYEDGVLSRWHTYLKAYQHMTDDELFVVQPVVPQFSVEALVSGPKFRAHCACCGEEIINQREVVVNGETLCRACAGDSYYTNDANDTNGDADAELAELIGTAALPTAPSVVLGLLHHDH